MKTDLRKRRLSDNLSSMQMILSEKIEKMKPDEPPSSGFILFENFATWLRNYVNPWVIQAGSQHQETRVDTFNPIKDAADQYDAALRKTDVQQNERLEAYSQFILALLINQLDGSENHTELVREPIFFNGDGGGIRPGIYNRNILNNNCYELNNRVAAAPENKRFSYFEINTLAKELECFYVEIDKYKKRMAQKISPEINSADQFILQWVKTYYDDTFSDENDTDNSNPSNHRQYLPTIAVLPSAAEQSPRSDLPEGLLLVFTTLGLITTNILLLMYLFDETKDSLEGLQSVPGEMLFPLWMGCSLGVYFGIIGFYHCAWVKRPNSPDDEYSPFVTFFLATGLGGIFGLIPGIFLDMEGAGTLIGCASGAVLTLLAETFKYLLFTFRAQTTTTTTHLHTTQATTGMRTPLLTNINTPSALVSFV